MVEQFEVANQITGEIIVCGWHVNTYQVGLTSHDFWLPWHHYQVDNSRILSDKEGKLWLRTEDAGYLDAEGRVWVMGRVKWRVDDNDGNSYWSIPVEQKVIILSSVRSHGVVSTVQLHTDNKMS